MARLPDGTLGYVLTAQGAGVDPTYAARTRLDLIDEVSVATDTTDVDITGLDINTHRQYLIIIKITNPTASETGYYLYVNEDYEKTNYYIQFIEASGTSIIAGRRNFPEIAHTFAGGITFVKVVMVRGADGVPRAVAEQAKHSPASITFQNYAWVKTASVTNITSIRIHAVATGAIGAGSKIEIYGYKA